jgi:hypothetical protein
MTKFASDKKTLENEAGEFGDNINDDPIAFEEHELLVNQPGRGFRRTG